MRALFGLTLEALGELLATVLPELVRRRQTAPAQRPNRQRAVGGGRQRRVKPDQEVLLTLVYLRHNGAHAVVGELCGVRAATSENTCHDGVLVLREVGPANRWDAEKKGKKGELRWTPATVERVLSDSFASPVRRPSLLARPKRVYAGKKKRQTLKTQVVSDAAGAILAIAPGPPGPPADKRLDDQSPGEERYPTAIKPGDLASQGIPGMRVPHKTPKGGHLTGEHRAENRHLASVRVQVEHGIRRLKGWRIVRDDYRLALGLFPLLASTVVGLGQRVRLSG